MAGDVIRGVGFDLDNTLYDQGQYMRSFFRQAAHWFEGVSGMPASRVEAVFLDTWHRRTSYYPYLFDEALRMMGEWHRKYVDQLVDQYHRHVTSLSLYPGVASLLDRLGQKYMLFLITDGHGVMQRNKVESLGIASAFRAFVYTGEHGPDWRKPSTLPFQSAAAQLNIDPRACTYVGDNPRCDFEGARKAGMITIRILSGPFAGLAACPGRDADYTLESITQLGTLLTTLNILPGREEQNRVLK
jgi:putative hydrolase of the HAD superfamily